MQMVDCSIVGMIHDIQRLDVTSKDLLYEITF